MFTELRRLSLIILLVLLAGVIPAQAGGLALQTHDTQWLTELRVLYQIDTAQNQTTVTLDMAFWDRGDRPFAILLPLPAEPLAMTTADGKESWGAYPWLIENTSGFDWAFERPRLVVREPLNVCEELVTTVRYCPHPYSAAAAYLDDSLQLLPNRDRVHTWLQDHDYAVPPHALDPYADNPFVVVEAQAESPGWGWLPLLSVTYPGTETLLPLQLFADNTSDKLPVEVAILADQPYTIRNYDRRLPDVTALHHTSALDFDVYFREEYCRSGFIAPGPPLQNHLADLLGDDPAFVPEYVGPVQDLLNPDLSADARAELETWIGAATHLTLLYMTPDSQTPTADPLLGPDPDGAPVAHVLDATGTNAFTYWGCATPPLPEDTEALLPARTYVPNLDKTVAHPAGWQVTRIAVNPDPDLRSCDSSLEELMLDVLAPQPVTLHDLRTALNGETALPMLVVTPHSNLSLANLIGVTAEPTNIQRSAAFFMPFSEQDWCIRFSNPQLDWFAPDWEENQALYEAILDSALAFHYYLDPGLPQTAFITTKQHSYNPYSWRTEGLKIAYPADWQIHTTPDETRYYWIEPDGVEDGPRLAILGWDVILDVERNLNYTWLPSSTEEYASWLEAVRAHYDLPPTLDLEAARTTSCHNRVSSLDERLVPFERNGRSGAFMLINTDVIELSVPPDTSEADWDTLYQMAQALDIGYCLATGIGVYTTGTRG